MTGPGFRPTHVVPRDGMPAWETPDPSRPTVPLDALLPVQLLDRRGDWGQVLCSNGWSAWVDGRLLVAVPQDPPGADGPPGRTEDPLPFLARAEETVARYRAAVEDLAGGRLDGEGFRVRTGGLRLGIVADGEALWLYDADRERWLHCDGTRLGGYAVTRDPAPDTDEPAPDPSPDHPPAEPTRVVQPQPEPGLPEPTRVVEPESPPAGPTRVVQPEPAPERDPHPDPAPRPAEPTRVVDPAAPSDGSAGVVGAEAGTDPDPAPRPAEPTRAMEPGEAPGEGAPAHSRRGERGEVAGRDETRLAPPVTSDE